MGSNQIFYLSWPNSLTNKSINDVHGKTKEHKSEMWTPKMRINLNILSYSVTFKLIPSNGNFQPKQISMS